MPNGTQTIAGVERALDVLSLFAETESPDLGVTEIADTLGLSKAVVHRILSSFRVKGFVEIDEATRRYRIGPKTLTVGLAYLNRIDTLDLMRVALAEVAERTEETATQSVRAANFAVYVGQVASNRQVRVVVRLGSAYPLHVGSPSLVLLANLPASEREAYLTGGMHVVDGEGVDVAALRERLDEIAQRGYEVSSGEREPGVTAVSAPIVDHTGVAVAALTVCGPSDRFDAHTEHHVSVVSEVARRTSEALGLPA